MKRLSVFSALLCLVLGVLLGILLPVPWDEPNLPSLPSPGDPFNTTPPSNAASGSSPASSSAVSGSATEPLNPKDNVSLLNAAYLAARAFKEEDYPSLASLVHPEKGVTFTPYSTVEPEMDLNFTQDQIKNLSKDDTVYTWGFVDGRGSPIQMTMTQYIQEYVFNTDYTQAPQLGIDRIMVSGNALENLSEAYPGCRFVDFSFPSLDPVNQGMDWCSLKLVFEPGESRWLLVGIIHGEWTI